METFFLIVLNRSISASWLILIVVVIHSLLKKIPKWLSCLLWAVVAIRLICPFSFESTLSLIPSAETISRDSLYDQEPSIHSGIPVLNSTVNPILADSFAPMPGASINPLQVWALIGAYIWLIGVVILLVYATISYVRLRKRVEVSLNINDNVWICDDIQTPFILGIIKPRIYLPSVLNEIQHTYVVAHEVAHLRRCDHWWKPLGYLLLTIYWFNPLCWVAYILLCRDIELACDERVISKMDKKDRVIYSEVLLSCSVPRKRIMACPLAFGEVSVKERINTILDYKKPMFWLMLVSVAIYIVVAICFLTNPVKGSISLKDVQTNTKMNNDKNSNSESINDESTTEVIKWFDYLQDNQMPWEESSEIEIPSYLDVTFRRTPYTVSAIHEGKERELFTGMPIWNAFFYDITGDGNPEICSTISIGSGLIDNRIVVFDYVEGVSYEISERGKFDYNLSLKNGNLLVEKYPFNSSKLLGEKPLTYKAIKRGKMDNLSEDSTTFLNQGELIRTYEFKGKEAMHTASISLYDNQEFLFVFSPLSSYIGHGKYTIEERRLTLKTEDGKYTYVFDRVDDKLVFDAEASSDRVWYSGITSGSVFE